MCSKWAILLQLFTDCAVAPASPVLTAIGFVNGKGQFSTSTESTPLNRSPNIKFVTGNYVGNPYSCTKLGVYPSTGGFWAHGWNITEIIFIYAAFLDELTYRSDPSTDFHALWHKRRGLAQGCAFLGFVHMAPHLGVQKNKKKTILGRE